MKTKKLTAWISAAALAATMITPITVSHAAQTTLTVGSGKQYSTISDAVAAAKTINPQSEADRVTINVDPGDYEEQVVFDGMKYVTLQQTPGTDGQVDLHWYYCTGYAASNVDLTGSYNPNIDWTADATWTGPNASDNLTKYTLGQKITAGTTITYYDKTGEKHSDTVTREMYLGDTGGLDKMAPLIVRGSSENITVKDFNIVNSVPVMVTQAELDAKLTPTEAFPDLPKRDKLTPCDENTAEVVPTDILGSNGQVDLTKYAESTRTFNAGESAWLARSGGFNERGHAVSVYKGDKITFDGIRLRGNQDSLYISSNRIYFKDCDIIGGTDYIYGNATAVFDNCKLGFANMSDRVYGSPLTAANTDAGRKYGYLFYNCTVYNMRENAGTSHFGRPWGSAAQVTFFNTTIDDNASVGKSKVVINEAGWSGWGAEEGKNRYFEYGTKNASGAAVDFSKRVVNASKEEGGQGMGTVLDDWQILEFNPRNYFAAECGNWSDDWDPMNFAAQLTDVDSAIADTTITIPSNEDTVFDLPQAPEGVTFKWESASTNAVVSEDGTKITVIRPAAGEENIETTVTLYAMDNDTGCGDKKEIPVSITPTTDTTNVFNIPVTIEQSTAAGNTYKITVSKNGALIKSQDIAVSETTAEATLENIPASAAGIDYDVTIVSESNDFTVTVPADGKTTVTGITGTDVPLAVTATKLVDETIDVNVTTTAADGNKTYDLIALAKANGANSSISSSDVISVEMDVNVAAALGSASYIDISSGTPSNGNGAVAQRFTIFKLNNSWTQIDTVDNTQGFSGSSNSEHQYLNITGKFDYSTVNHIKATIDYKAGTVTIDGSGSGSYKGTTPFTFGSFPDTAQKGTLNMGVFIGSTSDSITISNVQVTYKKIVSDVEEQPVEKEAKTITVTADGSGSGGTNDNGTYTISGTGAYYLDLNAIVNDTYFAQSDYVTVKYDVKQASQAEASVDITANSPLSAYNKNDTTRLVTARFGQWDQINVFTGSRTGAYKPDGSNYADAEDQILNIDGKTAQSGNPTVEFRIDRIAGKITVTGWKSDGTQVKSADLTAGVLPSDFGRLYLAVYPNNSTITLSNITVTYDTAKETTPATPIPDGEGRYVFRANNTEMTNGNQCDNTDEFTFLDGADSMLKTIFKSSEDSAKVNADLIANYKNYVGGTDAQATHPQIKVTPSKAGTYDIYLIGYNHGNNVSCTVGSSTFTAGAGVPLAAKTSDSGYVLKSYKIADVVLPAGAITITFDSTDQWLPDTYAAVVVGTAEKPDYEGVSMTSDDRIRYESKPGELADTYKTSIDYSTVNASALKWVIKNTAGEKAEENIETIISGNGNAGFGLIIYGTQAELDSIASVSLELQ